MKQTAVEQLQEYLTLSLGKDRMRMLFNEFEKAKAMEKEQITEAFKQGVAYWNGDEWELIDINEYYNQTFKSY